MRLSTLTAAAATLLLATACSVHFPTPATPAGTPSRASTNPSPSPSPSPLTGAQLKRMLAPASWFPAGFTADRGGAVNSGIYRPPSPAGHLPCTRLGATSWVDLAGTGSVSIAQDDYIDRANSQEYAEEIDVYQGTGAQATMAGLRKLAVTCPRFRDRQTSGTVTVKMRKGPRLGDDALSFTLTNPRWIGGDTLTAVRSGSAVVTVYCSANSGTGKAQAARLAALLVRNLHHRA